MFSAQRLHVLAARAIWSAWCESGPGSFTSQGYAFTPVEIVSDSKDPSHSDNFALDEIPLTFPQQLLWMLDFVNPGQTFSPGFIVRARSRIHGPVRPEVLREAFDRVIDRHDALRATIEMPGGMPFQAVHNAASIRLDVVSVGVGEHSAEHFFVGHEGEHRDVRSAPSIWARLGRVGNREHLLSTVANHALVDAWSMGLILDDVAIEYRRILDGDTTDRSAAPDYAAYARAQQSRDDADTEARLRYWAAQLEDVVSGPLAFDAERDPSRSDTKQVQRFVVPADLVERMAERTRRTRSTVFTMLLAAHAAHLASRCGSRDMVIPTITSLRHRPETVGLVGYLNNTVPLRIRLDDDPTLHEVLTAARQVTFQALANEVPLVLLMNHAPELGLLLSDDRYVTALFQHVPYDITPLELGDCKCVPVHHDNPPQITAMPVDLVCTMGTDRGRLVGDLCYTAELFHPETMTDLASGFVETLRAIVDTPTTRLSVLGMGLNTRR